MSSVTKNGPLCWAGRYVCKAKVGNVKNARPCFARKTQSCRRHVKGSDDWSKDGQEHTRHMKILLSITLKCYKNNKTTIHIHKWLGSQKWGSSCTHWTCRRWTCWEPQREMWTNLNPRAASLKTSDFFRAGFWCSNDNISCSAHKGLYIATFDVQKYVCFRITEMHGIGIWLVLQDLIPLKWSSKEIIKYSRPFCCLIQFFSFLLRNIFDKTIILPAHFC